MEPRVIELAVPGYVPMGLLALFLASCFLGSIILLLRHRPHRSHDGRVARRRLTSRTYAPTLMALSAAALLVMGYLFYREFFAVGLSGESLLLIYPWPRPARVIHRKDLEQVRIVRRAGSPGTRGFLLIKSRDGEFTSASVFTFTTAVEIRNLLLPAAANQDIFLEQPK